MNGYIGGSVKSKQRERENHVIYSRCLSCSASSSSTSECNRRKFGGRFKDDVKCFRV